MPWALTPFTYPELPAAVEVELALKLDTTELTTLESGVTPVVVVVDDLPLVLVTVGN